MVARTSIRATNDLALHLSEIIRRVTALERAWAVGPGGVAGSFVHKSGDTMTGALSITSIGSGPPDFAEKIRFTNENNRYSHLAAFDNTHRYGYLQFSDDPAANGIQLHSEDSGRVISIETNAGPVRIGPSTTRMEISNLDSRVTRGPWEIRTRIDVPADARYGHASTYGAVGYNAGQFGDLTAIVANNGQHSMWQRNAAGTSYDLIASFVMGATTINTTGTIVLSYGGANSIIVGSTVTLLGQVRFSGASAGVLIDDRNSPGVAAQALLYHHSQVFRLHKGGVGDFCTWDFSNYAMINYGKVQSYYSAPSSGWADANFIANSAGAAVVHTSMATPTNQAQFRVHDTNGLGIGVVNGTSTAFIPIWASNTTTPSSLSIKRGVRTFEQPRTFGKEREPRRPATPLSDTVDVVDVMALRPIVYRPTVPFLRGTPDGGCEPYPEDTVFGLEGTRERLGLIAEEVETAVPSAVSHDADGNPAGIQYEQITVALLEHVQRLTDEVATLRYRVAELEGRP